MKRLASLGCVIAGAALLGGCQSFSLSSWMFGSDRPASPSTELAANSVGALEEGKDSLREGNISAAVASLRIARLDRASFGEASNALAIAYARLGRADLADRYFREAILAEPENDKFAANLLRLQGQVMLARAQQAQPADSANEQPAPQPATERLAHGTVERVSRTEVRVRSRADLGNAPTAVVAYADTARPRAEPQAPETETAEQTRPSYPVRIRLPE